MAFIRKKTIKGNTYYYLVENKRHGRQVRQRVIKYLGPARNIIGGFGLARGARPFVRKEKEYRDDKL